MTQKVKRKRPSIKERNKLFRAMTPEQRRVEVARDVIEAIQTEHIQPLQGLYLDLKDFNTSDEYEAAYEVMNDTSISLQKRLDSEYLDGCEVCGIGSIFITSVRKFDRLKRFEGDFYDWSDSGGMRAYLASVGFSYPQQALIECAFEMSVYIVRNYSGILLRMSVKAYREALEQKPSMEQASAAVDFGERYRSSSSERLIAIMENIIENDGTFIP